MTTEDRIERLRKKAKKAKGREHSHGMAITDARQCSACMEQAAAMAELDSVAVIDELLSLYDTQQQRIAALEASLPTPPQPQEPK